MREILSDQYVRAECDMYKPYSQRFLLNDLKQQQATRFKPGSKMNLFLRTVSGSRPQSVIAQALASGTIKIPQVAEDLAARLKFVYESGQKPEVIESAVDTLMAEAEIEQERVIEQRNQAIQAGMPFSEVVATQEKAMQTEVMQEEVTAMMQELSIEHEEEKSKPMDDPQGPVEIKEFLMQTNRKLALRFYRALTGKEPDASLRVRGSTKEQIVEAILQEKPDLTHKDIHKAMDTIQGTQRPRREHMHAVAKDVEPKPESEIPPGLEGQFESAKQRLSADEIETISGYLTGGQRTAGGDEAISQYLTEGHIEQQEGSSVRTAAARFEQQYKLPRIMDRIRGAFFGERSGERLARSHSAGPRAGVGYVPPEEPLSRASSASSSVNIPATPRQEGEL